MNIFLTNPRMLNFLTLNSIENIYYSLFMQINIMYIAFEIQSTVRLILLMLL